MPRPRPRPRDRAHRRHTVAAARRHVRGPALLGACLVSVVALLTGTARPTAAPEIATPAPAVVVPTTAPVTTAAPTTTTAPPDPTKPVSALPLARQWHAPADLPAAGRLTRVTIPGTVSGFSARDGYVWVPPAYLTSPGVLPPVLVLLAGQPGSPEDWLGPGRLTSTMDAWAARHHGLAPVVVLADATGTRTANPLCLDSILGAVQTYLTVDVPAWITSHLQVQPGAAQRAIGGFSYGGTCSLQLGVNRPDVYPTILDESGQDEPTLGTREDTVAAAFGGDAARFAAVNPLDVLAAMPLPHSAIRLVVGTGDTIYRPQDERVADAARAAGLDTHLDVLDGSHDFTVWTPGLAAQLDWLGTRLGITA